LFRFNLRGYSITGESIHENSDALSGDHMKHSILLTSVGLCLFSMACGGTDNGLGPDGSGGGGAAWSDPVDLGEAGAAATDGESGSDGDALLPSDVVQYTDVSATPSADPEANVVSSTAEALSIQPIWALQLPSGSGTSPKTIAPKSVAGYSDAYFKKAADGGQIFMDPQHGITTSGSKHPRCEMRESTSSGAQAGWSPYASNTMTVVGKVLKVGGGSGGDVTIGQVFNGSDSITMAELQYSNGSKGFKLFYEEAKGQGGKPLDLHVPIAIGEKYTFTMGLSKGKLTVSVNGKQVYSKTPSSSALNNKFYFKFGNYDQTATAGSISTTPYTQVEVYSASVSHN